MISMMIDPEFISASTHSLAEDNVSQRNPEKQDRHTEKDHVLHRSPPIPGRLELHQDRHGSPILGITKIREPGSSVNDNHRTGTSSIPARRCDSPRAAPVRHIGMPVVELPAEGNVLEGPGVVG